MVPLASDVLVQVTAGPTYDPTTHQTVIVNASTPTHICSDVCTANISVRIQNYQGLPHGSPKTSSYFDHLQHKKDQYSIYFTLIPHKTILGSALVFGNDIDHPVRDRLPYGTGAAFKILKTVIDPGLDGDLYADKPHLYGCALSSLNTLRVGGKLKQGEKMRVDNGHGDEVLEEGADDSGIEFRKSRDVPEDSGKRKAWFLENGRPETWEWEEGRFYKGDFFNPYLDFNDFSLKLPGFSISVLGYLGGEDYLRYVLKIKDTEEVLFVVVFSLVSKDETGKEEAGVETDKDLRGKNEAAEKQERENSFQPREDDVD